MPLQHNRPMIPAPNVAFSALDDADIVDDVLSVFMVLSDGSTIAAIIPIDELIARGHTVIEAEDAPAFHSLLVLQ